MASREPPTDPRLATAPAAAAAPAEAGVRPVVAVPRGGPSGLMLGIGAVAAGAILFAVLESRRHSISEPSVRVRAADATGLAPPPPPLYIPPAPAPVPLTVVEPAPAFPPEARRPAPPPPPPPPPISAPRTVYIPQQAPPAFIQPQQAPQRTSNSPTLVIDNTAAAPVANSSQNGVDNASGPTTIGGVQPGGRVRSGVFANRATTVMQGTLLPAVLETAFDSTRPGLARAMIQRDVRGFDGTRVLIPRGSRLIGEYRSEVNAGQKRALINWTRLVRPDGVTIALGSPAADTLGRGGVRAHVNSHFFERFAGAILQSALDVGVNLATRAASGNNVIVALPGSTQNSLAPLFQSSRVVPTLTVPAGTSISVFVARDLDFSGAERAQ